LYRDTDRQPIVDTRRYLGQAEGIRECLPRPACLPRFTAGPRAEALRGVTGLDTLAMLAFVLPASVLGVGLIAVWNRPATGALYGSMAILVIGYVGSSSETKTYSFRQTWCRTSGARRTAPVSGSRRWPLPAGARRIGSSSTMDSQDSAGGVTGAPRATAAPSMISLDNGFRSIALSDRRHISAIERG
jgi:hypothetical protein